MLFSPLLRQAIYGFACLIAMPLATAATDTPLDATSDAGSDAGANSAAAPAATSAQPTPTTTLSAVVITAERLNDKRAGIQTQTGASTYTIDDAAIAATPGGDNTLLNQVVLQAPDVAQDSFGQFHVRGDHNDLQYRLNGIILPEGISVFGQSLSPRLIGSLQLITGALPAQYGLRTAGIIDMTTKSGALQPGGEVSVYGGTHGTFEPSADYGGAAGNFNYFVSADMLRSDLGIESPDGSVSPIHDHTSQYHGFGYFEDILGDSDRLALIAGISNDSFEIPDIPGQTPGLGLSVNGQTDFDSALLNESQHELTDYAVLSWQHSQGPLDLQSSVSVRYSSLSYVPDPVGDLLFNGISQWAFKDDTALAWQTDAAYKLGASHTVRAGLYLQHDEASSDTGSLVVQTAQVLPTDPLAGAVTPVADDESQTQWMESVYLQDEWKILSSLTLNYGLRFDHYQAYSSGSQVSPRINVVWQLPTDTTLHAGFSRYFTPPPFELVGGETIGRFVNTSASPAVIADTTPVAERASYFDVGVQQRLLQQRLTLGIDSYYRRSQNLIDEGQFGAPIILTPFNYQKGKIEGIEFTGNYARQDWSVYGNLAFQSALGRNIETSQFNFDPDDLKYIAGNYIHLDHEQRVTASAGASYLLFGTRLSADMLIGSGLRADLALPDGTTIPNGAHLASYTQINFGMSHAFDLGPAKPLTVRFDIINAFDKIYEIRDGTGVGVGAPQFGQRRGFFFGLSKQI
ncbi:MAG TPA: TonB-dependent receptor [Steroidobacteraceae bacterium]|jgi:outer membrane receptor protein involved in Fe transport|nr:TonB-dependent receptor [Steroidobacteraceae bacterium]